MSSINRNPSTPGSVPLTNDPTGGFVDTRGTHTSGRSGGIDGDDGAGDIGQAAPGAAGKTNRMAGKPGTGAGAGVGDDYAGGTAGGKDASGWRGSDLDDGKAGVAGDSDGAGGGTSTFGVPTSPTVKAALTDGRVKDFGQWVNNEYSAGNPDVRRFVDNLAANQSSSSAAAAETTAGAAGAAADSAGVAGAAAGSTGDGVDDVTGAGTGAGTTGDASDTGYGNFGSSSDLSWAAQDAKKLYSQFQGSVVQRSLDDKDTADDNAKKDDAKHGGKAGAAGSSKATAGAAGAGKATAGVAGAASSSSSDVNGDGTGTASYTSSGDVSGMGGLTGMELVQAVMLEAAAEASKNAESIAKTVQQNTAQKDQLRTQVDALRTSLSGVKAANMTSQQSDDNTQMQNLQDQMDSIGDDNQILFIRLQNSSQQYTTMLQGVSNVSKNLYDIDKSVIGNVGH